MSDRPAHMLHLPDLLAPAAPIIVDHAVGSWVYATDGSEWLDLAMGIAVVNTGHCHPEVVAAVREQAARMAHCQTGVYRHQPMLDLAAKLAEVLPDGIDTVMFANSGAEAVENAVKLAKQATRRPATIAFQGAFHGRTHLAMALNDSGVQYRGHHEPLPGGVYHARYCYPFRTPVSEDPTDYAIEDVRRVLRTEVYGDDVAAILVEPIQGESGIVVPTTEFIGELRRIADDIGAMLILDEIQSGMGRTGRWFCLEHYGVRPDIVAIAKGIASGYPLSAIAAPKALWDECLPASMGGTFGGNAVACAAGVATIDAMREEDMLANAVVQGEKLTAFLQGLQESYACLGEVRGKGLMLGIECVLPGTKEPDAVAAKAFIAEAARRRLILLGAGTFGNCVRFAPALNVNDGDLGTALDVLEACAEAAFA
jgi:4-aminobutyrate aminotransferase